MRHRVKKKKLKRATPHRLSLLRNLAAELIIHEKIITTIAKAKALKSYVDSVISLAKKFENPAKSRQVAQIVFAKLGQNKNATKKLLQDIIKKYKDRVGGYTSVVRLGWRKGDGAEKAIIKLV